MKLTIRLLTGVLLVALLIASLSACSKDETTTTTSSTQTTAATTTSTSTSATETSATTSPVETTATTETSEPVETTTTPELDESAIRAFADDIALTMMEGLSEADLEKYTRHGNEVFKEAVTQDMIDTLNTGIEEDLGSFVSITFLSCETADNYIIVHYSVEYSKETVGVMITFDEDHLVAGQFFE